MKKENGSLVIEASIALTTFIFFVLFFISFAQVYRAQNVIAHASFQTSQTLAVESFAREKIGESGTLEAVTKLNDFLNSLGINPAASLPDNYRSLGTVSNLNSIIRKEFVYSIADSEAEANDKLISLGIKDGLNGLDFSNSSVTDSDIIINLNYTVKLQFAFFGKSEIKLSKTACCKSFAKIEENNSIPK